jgi:hypothetical protein
MLKHYSGHARGLRGANESGSSNQSATVTFHSHFPPQPSDLVNFVSLFFGLKVSMTDGASRAWGQRAESARVARSGLLSPLIFLCAWWWVKTLDRPVVKKILQSWFSTCLGVCGGDNGVREEEGGVAAPAALGEDGGGRPSSGCEERKQRCVAGQGRGGGLAATTISPPFRRRASSSTTSSHRVAVPLPLAPAVLRPRAAASSCLSSSTYNTGDG